MSSAEAPEAETPGQRAARLRREKRQNKIAGEERLAKIKQLNGGIAPSEEILGGPVPAHVSDSINDPDEVDISATSYGGQTPTRSNASYPANDPMQALLRMQAQQGRQQGPQGSPGANMATAEDDPMAKMMQQFMGMAGGDPNDPNNIHNAQDPMQMLSALMGAQKQFQGGSAAQQTGTSSTYLWKITHAIFAIIIAGYIAATSTFDGSLLARTQSAYYDGESSRLGHRLFLIFVTAELGLQSTRFYLEGGRLQGSGMLASISQIAPEPWAGYVRAAGRWISIMASIVSDAMVVIFVLGVMAWWNGSITT